MADINVSITLSGNGLATRDELGLRFKFEDQITERGIGHVTGGGSGCGEMDISLIADDAQVAKSKLRELAEELGLSDRTSIDI